MDTGILIFWVLFGLAMATLATQRWMLDALIDAINRFGSGGPRTPMHPSPAGDVAFLKKPSLKAKTLN